MSNIVFSDAEVRMIGGNRWAREQKKYTRLYQLVALLAIIGTLILWVSRDNLLVLIVLLSRNGRIDLSLHPRPDTGRCARPVLFSQDYRS